MTANKTDVEIAIKQLEKAVEEGKLFNHECKFVNEILIVFQKNFRKCGKRLFCDYKNGKKPTYINETNKNFNIKVRQNSRPQKSA